MGCIACGRGYHEECLNFDCDVCHKNVTKLTNNLLPATGKGKGRPALDPDKVTDDKSTGRKRAALLWPIFKDKPCDWRGKKNCGGGSPITGCIEGYQRHRHHGPVKNTLRNEPGNVHRICEFCHNRWHTINDSLYDEENYEGLLHRPEEASSIELLANEALWRLRPIKKVMDDDDEDH